MFIPLYPVGMLAEMFLMAKSLPYLKSQKLNTITLPNALNVGFSYHLFIQVRGLICLPEQAAKSSGFHAVLCLVAYAR